MCTVFLWILEDDGNFWNKLIVPCAMQHFDAGRQMTKNDKEWQRMTKNNKEWQGMTKNPT